MTALEERFLGNTLVVGLSFAALTPWTTAGIRPRVRRTRDRLRVGVTYPMPREKLAKIPEMIRAIAEATRTIHHRGLERPAAAPAAAAG